MLNSDQLLTLIRDKVDHPATVRELLQRLKLPREDRPSIKSLLRQLVANGSLIETRGSRYGLPDRMNLVVGRVQTHPRGFGFVVPDRPIDGVDQLDFLLGRQERSNREGFVFYIKDELRAVKWRNWKMHLVWEREPNAGALHLEAPYLFNLIQDPKEETDMHTAASWVRTPMRRMIHEFQESLKAYRPIPPGAPDDYAPAKRSAS